MAGFTVKAKSNPNKGFDYNSAYGTNPYSDVSMKIWELVNRMTDRTGPSGDSYGFRTIQPARPGDAEVRDYMANVLAGQRNTLDDYVRRTAGAGVKRGGMNVVGGPPLESSLSHQAMSTLARGYSDRFRDAMDYNKYAKDTQYKQYSDKMSNLQDLLGLQHQYLSSGAGWQSHLGDQMLTDWRSDRDWDRTTPERDLALQNMRQAVETQRWRDLMEKQNRTLTAQEKNEMETKWRELANKGDIGWNSPDAWWAERLGILMGYFKPWNRSLSVKMGK